MAVAALKPPPAPCGTWTPATLSSADRMAAASRGAMGCPARSPETANTWPYLMAASSGSLVALLRLERIVLSPWLRLRHCDSGLCSVSS